MMAYQMYQAIKDAREVVLPRLRRLAQFGLFTPANCRACEGCRDLLDAAARSLSADSYPLIYEEESLCLLDALALCNEALCHRRFSRERLTQAVAVLAVLEEIGGAA